MNRDHIFMRDGDQFPTAPLGPPIRPSKDKPVDAASPEAWVRQPNGLYRNTVTGKLSTQVPTPAKPPVATVVTIDASTPSKLGISDWVKRARERMHDRLYNSLAGSVKKTSQPGSSTERVQLALERLYGTTTGRMSSSQLTLEELPRKACVEIVCHGGGGGGDFKPEPNSEELPRRPWQDTLMALESVTGVKVSESIATYLNEPVKVADYAKEFRQTHANRETYMTLDEIPGGAPYRITRIA